MFEYSVVVGLLNLGPLGYEVNECLRLDRLLGSELDV
jgi:hypothetical protein